MKSRPTHFRGAALGALASLLMVTAALAAPPGAPADAQARYLKDKAACESGKSNEDKATCLKEAGAALDAAKQGELADKGATYKRNALARCQELPGDQRADCIARMHGEGTTEGSAAAGGIFREKVTMMPAKPGSPASDPSPTPMPKMP